MSTNNYIQDQLTNRAIDEMRIANQTAASASSGLFALYRDIIKRLKETPTSRWYRLAADVEKLLANEMRGVVKEIKADLGEFAPIEARFAENMLVTATTIDTIGRTPEQIIALFTKKPINNFVSGRKVTKVTVDDLLLKLTKDNPKRVKQIIRDASLEGKTAQQISKEIRSIAVNATRNDIEATVLTSFNHYSNQAKDAVYQQNSDILDGIELVATLDSRTTLVCMSLDGQVFALNKGPRPPFHYRCRTQAVPRVNKKYQLPIKGRTRASEHGPVNAQMTYDGFLRRQSKERQIQILGPSRARLFRQGMPVSKFVNDKGVRILVKDLPESY